MAKSVTPDAISTLVANPSPDSSEVPETVVQDLDLKPTGSKYMFTASDDKSDAYHTALGKRTSDEALLIIKEKNPKRFVTQYHKLKSNLDKIFVTFVDPILSYVPKFPLSTFNNVPEILQRWVFENVKDLDTRPHKPISLILEGKTRIGKTTWARALGLHNYISGYIDLNSRVFSNEAWYNVIDNVSPSYLKSKHWKEFLGAQRDWQTNCKYGKSVQVKGGIPTIILCNPGKGSSYTWFLDRKVNAELKQWTLKNAIFYIQTELLWSQ